MLRRLLNRWFPNRKVTRHCRDCGTAFRTKARYHGKWGNLCGDCIRWQI